LWLLEGNQDTLNIGLENVTGEKRGQGRKVHQKGMCRKVGACKKGFCLGIVKIRGRGCCGLEKGEIALEWSLPYREDNKGKKMQGVEYKRN